MNLNHNFQSNYVTASATWVEWKNVMAMTSPDCWQPSKPSPKVIGGDRGQDMASLSGYP